jgi:hypothetical protein
LDGKHRLSRATTRDLLGSDVTASVQVAKDVDRRAAWDAIAEDQIGIDSQQACLVTELRFRTPDAWKASQQRELALEPGIGLARSVESGNVAQMLCAAQP